MLHISLSEVPVRTRRMLNTARLRASLLPQTALTYATLMKEES